MEPREPSLTDEPYWRTLTKLVDWAEDHTISGIWSCLAAHAAVLHADGIVRRALRERLVGVFECVKAGDHAVVLGVPPQWRVPHSRHNKIPEGPLVAKDYRILSRSADAGVDMLPHKERAYSYFCKAIRSMTPGRCSENIAETSGGFSPAKEYSYPEIPRDYFDPGMVAAVAAFQQKALDDRGIDLASGFPAVADEKLTNEWHGVAATIYANWLSYLVERRRRVDAEGGEDVRHATVN